MICLQVFISYASSTSGRVATGGAFFRAFFTGPVRVITIEWIWADLYTLAILLKVVVFFTWCTNI